MIGPEQVDRVLLQVGKVGRFHVLNCLVVDIPILLSALYTITYVFTAQDLTYRCLVAECEAAGSAPFLPPWLSGAVPFDGGQPEPCSRFARAANATAPGDGTCPASLFERTRTEPCQQWVYQPGQRDTLANEWDLTCGDKWKLSLVGTIGYAGAFVGMPLSGFLSDRFGRRTLLIWAWVLSSASGLAQSFSTSYVAYVMFEFCNSFLEAGVYAAGFLLALEFVGPEQRVLTTTVLCLFYAVGNALLGGLAWALRDWRWLLRAVYGAGLVSALPLWYTPESVRWLVARGRLEEADAVVARVAAVNKVAVSETFAGVAAAAAAQLADEKAGGPTERDGDVSTVRALMDAFKSRALLLRFVNCAYCWIANTFVYYGLSLNAVSLSGDEYVNFILSGLVEVPANVLAIWLQNKAGRRIAQAGSLLVAGVSCLAFLVIPTDEQWLQVLVYMLGKFAITISFTVVYVLTAEMFPTKIRQSMVSYGSTFGRIGSMLAPQTPLLASVNESLPLLLFGIVSLSSGLLSLLFPETKGRPLPETIQEAEAMSSFGCTTCVL